MSHEATADLFARADELAAEFWAEIGNSVELRAESVALLGRLRQSLSQISEMKAKSRAVIAASRSRCGAPAELPVPVFRLPPFAAAIEQPAMKPVVGVSATPSAPRETLRPAAA